MGFSEGQRAIIDCRQANILVSAAAGSGKTTVLVQRIIERILDETDPVNIDEILVLTFTKAAASEMRERIIKALNAKLDENPDNEHLKKQTLLIYNAQITTIDSFCLNILKNNFAEIGLEPGFRLASDAEMTFIIDEVLENCIEELLKREDRTDIDIMLERFHGKDNYNKLKDVILSLYREAENAPFVMDYFEMHKSDYDVSDYDSLLEKEWFKSLCRQITCDINSAKELAIAFEKDYGPNELCEYADIIATDIELLEKLSELDYAALMQTFADKIAWKTLPRKVSCTGEIKEKVQEIRKIYKDLINDINKNYFGQSMEQLLYRMQQSAEVNRALMEVTGYFTESLEECKRRRGLITFSDMEHLALKILLKKEDGAYVPSQTAFDYRDTFKELMIDEYQDSNYIQEALIHSISGEDEGRYDRFIVGDIKQSIYRFRNANPELFMEKYDLYNPEGPLRRFDLSMNYRSREEVLNAVNTVFERIMDREIGGVDYDSNQRLYVGASYEDSLSDNKAELLVVSPDSEGELSDEELEALMIAGRIKNLVADHLIYDKDKKDFRKCTYRDIVILLRSGGELSTVLRRVFEDRGIPVYVTTKSGYFSSIEIVTLLNYLSVLNNPYNEIPMFGSLTSIFGGFTDDEVAILKIINRAGLYDALIRISADDFNVEEEIPELALIDISTVKNKATAFLERLINYRNKIASTPIHVLIKTIMDDYEYVNYFGAFPGGEQKKANILMLLSKAKGFENDGFKGLFNFCRYIEKLHKYESDEGEVVSINENANVVRIMTMHKSKGLEFPVCILAGLSKGINRMDERNEVIFHGRYGLGMNYVDRVRNVKYDCLRKKFIASAIHKDSLSEELRILYVAMTRAEEKLIMTCVSDESLKADESMIKTGIVPDALRMKISSYADIFRLTEYSDDWSGQIEYKSYSKADVYAEGIPEDIKRGRLLAKLNSMRKDVLSSNAYEDIRAESEDIRKGLEFVYPHEYLKDMYVKTSVSELKMAAISDGLDKGSMEELPVEFFKLHDEKESYIPSFAVDTVDNNSDTAVGSAGPSEGWAGVAEGWVGTSVGSTGTTAGSAGAAVGSAGAAIGSAYHRVLELIDYKTVPEDKSCINADLLDLFMRPYIESGAITEDEYRLVAREKILAFLKSDLAYRMMQADKSGLLHKEQPFVLGIEASRLNDNFKKEETVLIQGIIDVFFIENNEIVLMDYKTDRVKTEDELIKRYKTQLDYYEEALERILGLKVKERLIYSFSLGKTLSL